MTQEEISGGGAAKASWESLQQGALDHYEELATKAHHWSSFVPAAIKAYKNTEYPNQFLEWLDKNIKEAEVWKGCGSNPDKTQWDVQISILSAVREKFLTLTPPPTTLDK